MTRGASVRQAARNATKVGNRIQRVVATAERTTGEAAKVIEGAAALSAAADQLSRAVETFLGGLKSAA
jgi:hypothetical protein